MHRPEKPSIASRACVVSASSMNFFVSGLPQGSRGSKPKSPAARPEPFAACTTETIDVSSATAANSSMTPMLPDASMASWACSASMPAYFSPGKWMPASTVSHPTTASMQMRPCLSSASRIQ